MIIFKCGNVRRKAKAIVIILILFLFILAWAPWLDDKEIHDRVFCEKAYKDGTIGWVTYPDETVKQELICDYNVM